MPRDLENEGAAPPITLTESPNSVTTERSESPASEQSSPSTERQQQQQQQFVIVPEAQQAMIKTTNLHPYTRPLTLSDLESCVALENAAFTDPRDRATPEKVSQSIRPSVLEESEEAFHLTHLTHLIHFIHLTVRGVGLHVTHYSFRSLA